MDVGEPLEQRPSGGVQVAAALQVVGKAPHLVERPRLKGCNELLLIDNPVLKREQAKEQVARWVDETHHDCQLLIPVSCGHSMKRRSDFLGIVHFHSRWHWPFPPLTIALRTAFMEERWA